MRWVLWLVGMCCIEGFFRPPGFRPVFHVGGPQYPFSKKYHEEYLRRIRPSVNKTIYPISPRYYEQYLRRLNSPNRSIEEWDEEEKPEEEDIPIRFIFKAPFQVKDDDSEDTPHKSKNFEFVKNTGIRYSDVGGYDAIKYELNQCIDLLTNYSKYAGFNVRVPKGLILEGPPGNGKTLLAKAFAGEANCRFIAVSGSEFQEKYVGVGASRIRELFGLAKKSAPCIVFIDEIDALGRNRAKDGESSSAERDNTLNELLVALDGFKNTSGVFLIGATNRADLLDPALIRPGRIDKRIFIGNPDENTRREVIKIHSSGKPRSSEIVEADLVDMTAGFSCAQIENLLNEAMLHALRDNRLVYDNSDLDSIYSRILVGWQPTEHIFTRDIIDHIAIHEMGHAIMGLLSKHHMPVKKVVINLSAPHSPGYTLFETTTSPIYVREALFEHLTVLLAGRVAEEAVYGVSVTTGAINDFEEALKLAEKMILYYGMGSSLIYPTNSEKYKEKVDNEISGLLQQAYDITKYIIETSKPVIQYLADELKYRKKMDVEEITEIIHGKYSGLFDL